MLHKLMADELAVICSFLFGSYSFYDGGDASTTDDHDEKKSDVVSDKKVQLYLEHVMPVISLMHTHSQLHDNIYHNELIWGNMLVPFPDFLRSKAIFRFLNDDTDCELEIDQYIFELVKDALHTLCDTTLIKRICITRMLKSQDKLDWTGYIMKHFPNVTDLQLCTKFDTRQSLFNDKNFMWKNLKRVSVTDYKSLEYFVNHPNLKGNLESVAFYIVRSRELAVQLIKENDWIGNLEILSTTSLEEVPGILENKKVTNSISVLKLEPSADARSRADYFAEILQTEMYKFCNLEKLSLNLIGLRLKKLQFGGTFKRLKECGFRMNLADLTEITFTQFLAPQLKMLSLANCHASIDRSTCSLPKLSTLNFSTVRSDDWDNWTQLPFISTFYFSYLWDTWSVTDPVKPYTLNFINHNHIRNVFVSGGNSLNIEDCTEVKNVTLRKTRNIRLSLENGSLSLLKIDGATGDVSVNVKYCETVFALDLRKQLDIPQIGTLIEHTEGVFPDRSNISVDRLNLYVQESLNNETLIPYLRNFHSIGTLKLLFNKLNSNALLNCSLVPIRDFSTLLQSSSNQELEYLYSSITKSPPSYSYYKNEISTILNPKHPFETLTLLSGSAMELHETDSLHSLKIMKRDHNQYRSALVFKSTLSTLTTLEIAGIKSFTTANLSLQNLKYVDIKYCEDVDIDLEDIPQVRHLVVTGKSSEVTLRNNRGLHDNIVICNLCYLKKLSIRGSSQLSAPKLREFVIIEIMEKDYPDIKLTNSPMLLCSIQKSTKEAKEGKTCSIQ